MGCIIYDPNNTNVLWLGTVSITISVSLGYGNGVYKSCDGGKSWNNMGLKDSRQIGRIVVDPRNSDVVFVAAEGSVWGPEVTVECIKPPMAARPGKKSSK